MQARQAREGVVIAGGHLLCMAGRVAGRLTRVRRLVGPITRELAARAAAAGRACMWY